ncbi:hypothetical protein B0H16DRAFT_1623225, partial [Mycena metata]
MMMTTLVVFQVSLGSLIGLFHNLHITKHFTTHVVSRNVARYRILCLSTSRDNASTEAPPSPQISCARRQYRPQLCGERL